MTVSIGLELAVLERFEILYLHDRRQAIAKIRAVRRGQQNASVGREELFQMTQEFLRMSNVFDNFASRDDVESSNSRRAEIKKITRQQRDIPRIDKICRGFSETLGAQVVCERRDSVSPKACAQ
ncbi:MAG TPA: hypothetical protein VJ718_01140 [Candidatus Binataceae bacterium]|nr:hypothetical protein [Candidatus Binataceae bacterium]